MSAGVSRWFLLVFAALVFCAALVQLAAQRSARPSRFLGGTEARILDDLVLPPDTVAVIPADLIGTGEVVEIVQRGVFTYVLHTDQWLRIGAGEVSGPYGRGADGAPGVFDNASDILPTDTTVYVLERLPARIITFRHDGSYVRAFRVRSGDSTSVYVSPERFALSSGGFQVLLTHYNASGRVDRELVSGADNSWQRLYWLPADSLMHITDDVLLDLRGDTIAALLTMLGYRFHVVGSDGRARIIERPDPPHYSISDSIRWDYERKTANVPRDLRDRIALPEFIPPVRAFSLLESGHTAVALSRDVDHVSIEVLDSTAAPLWRSRQSLETPVFLHGDQLFRVVEQPNHLVVLRHRIKGAAEWPK